MWKLGTFAGLGAAAILLVLLMKARKGDDGGAPAGAARGDARGAVSLEVQRVTLGPKAVAEAGKKVLLGETKAAARETEKSVRKG